MHNVTEAFWIGSMFGVVFTLLVMYIAGLFDDFDDFDEDGVYL